MRFTRGVIAMALVGAAVVGCASLPSPIPHPSGFVNLPTLPGVSLGPGETPAACGGVGLGDAFLHGSAVASDPVWLETVAKPSGRVAVGWPAGFWARFSPSLELIDATGTVVAREGDRLSKIGGFPGSDGRFFVWEFNGRDYPCQ